MSSVIYLDRGNYQISPAYLKEGFPEAGAALLQKQMDSQARKFWIVNMPDSDYDLVSVQDRGHTDVMCICGKHYSRYVYYFAGKDSPSSFGAGVHCIPEGGIPKAAVKKFADFTKAILRENLQIIDRYLKGERPNKFKIRGVKYSQELLEYLDLDLPLSKAQESQARVYIHRYAEIEKRTRYLLEYQVYLKFINVSLQAQPDNDFLLQMKDKIKKGIGLTSKMKEALDRGMVGDWETKLKEKAENVKFNQGDINASKARLDVLMRCKLGHRRDTVISFRKQLRNGRPLSDDQKEVLAKWEKMFAKQIHLLETGGLNRSNEETEFADF